MPKQILIFVLAAGAAAAQLRLTEDQAVAKALAARHSLAAAAERLRAARARQQQARAWPNPRLTLYTEGIHPWSAQGYRIEEVAEYFAFATQQIETGGKRARRAEAAGGDARIAALESQLEAARLGVQVRQAYWSAAAARKTRESLEAAVALLNEVIEIGAARVSAGTLPEADLIRARIEGQQLELESNSATLEAERARIALLQEMAASEFPEIEFATPFEVTAAPEIPAPERAMVEQRIELRIARQKVENARAALRLAEAEAVPDVDIQFGYKRTMGFDTLLGGVEIPLPLWNRNKGAITASNHEVGAAEAELAAQQALVRAEVQASSRELSLRRREVIELLPALRSHAEEIFRTALAGYRNGISGVHELLDAQRNRSGLEARYYRSVGEYHRSRVALEYATGMRH